MYTPLKSYPTVIRGHYGFNMLEGELRGLDLEWGEGKITVLGMSDDKKAVSVAYDKKSIAALNQAIDSGKIFVGHNIVGADLSELAEEGINIPLKQCEDTIIYFWINNSHLCKTSKKTLAGSDEEVERKGRGFMNLATMLSIYTDLPNHKYCREVAHEGKEKVFTGEYYKTGKRKGEPKSKQVSKRIIKHPCIGPCPQHDVFGYNGLDCLGPVQALKGLKRQTKIRGLDGLVKLHHELMHLFVKIRRRGVPVDVGYVKQMRIEFAKEKLELAQELPFLGKKAVSTKKALEWFKQEGISLPNLQEETIRKAVENNSHPMLQLLLDYKELGNGIDRWFGDKFLKNGFIHPGMNFFTSSARLMCSNPNMQNVTKRRIDRKTGEKVGNRVRRAVAAPPGYYIYSADYKNAENRNFLYLAGYKDIPNEDFHTWMQKLIGITESDPFALAMGGARQAAKSVVHSTDYLEGIKLVPMITSKLRLEEAKGIRIIYPDWKFEGKIVTFTGINLARRCFGSASVANRQRALAAQQKYFQKFPLLLNLYHRITKQCEEERAVRPPHGYYMTSYGYAEDRIKTAASIWGCLPAETLILTSDLRWVPQGDLVIGQELIGIEEKPYKGRRRKLIPSKILNLGKTFLPTYRIITDKGEVIASEEHPWLTRQTKTHWGHSFIWTRTDMLKVGWKIAYLVKPWKKDTSYEAGYLAVGIDGEGSIDHRLTFYQSHNKMLSTMEKFAKERSFNLVNDQLKKREGYKSMSRLSIQGLPENLKFAGSIKPKRVDTKKLWNGITSFGKYTSEATILAIEPLGRREVIGMKTSTHTFVANGMFTHNSQPVAHFTKLSLMRAEHLDLNSFLQIHDEILFLIDAKYDPMVVKKKITEAMVFETPEMPGFSIPIDVSYGRNWADQKEI